MKMLLNGHWVEREKCIPVRNPDSGELVDRVPQASKDDMIAAVDAAVDGAARMRKLPVHQRMRILNQAADAVAADAEAFACTIAAEGIKTITEARSEVARCVMTLRLSAEEARRIDGETIAFGQRPGSEDRRGFHMREPVGIVAAVTPFNDPLNLVAHKLGPALAAGNACIVKPHEKTPLSALKLAEVIEAAGAPQAAVQVITGLGAEVGAALVRDPRVRLVSFTGGLATGKKIQAAAGLKKTTMELGGNGAVIVMDDADLIGAVDACAGGAFCAAGQNCIHVQRIYIHEDLYQGFLDAFVKAACAIRCGNQMDPATEMGPMIDEAAALRVQTLVQDAVSAGATLLTGGNRHGARMEPTVLSNLPKSHKLNDIEVFGPVTVLYRFSEVTQAVAAVNASEFGLHAGVFTRNLDTAWRLAEALDCGGVMINDSSDYRIDAMPFGGRKASGLGREGVRFAIQEMTEPKVVCFNLAQT